MIKKIKIEFNKILNFFEKYLLNINYGKLHPSIIKDIKININNINYNIYSLANINIVDRTTLKIIPYDIKNIKNIKKKLFLFSNKIGSNIKQEKNFLILKISLFTEEKRLELIKEIKKKLEEIKNNLRNIRNKFLSKLKNEKYSEDEKKNIKKEIQKIFNENFLKLKNIFNNKKKDILNFK